MAMLEQQRQGIRRVLDSASPADAPTAYYALYHAAERSALFTQAEADGQITDFVGRFQTGLDLFRPLVTLRCSTPEAAAHLLADALTPERPYILFADAQQRALVGGSLDILTERVLAIYALIPTHFRPVINVLLQRRTAPDGSPYFVIESNDRRAVAGLNWRSPNFAEIYVHTDAAARQQGWGKSVAAAMTQAVLENGRVPLYLVEEDNISSRRLAESLGYADTGARQLYAETVYLGPPNN